MPVAILPDRAVLRLEGAEAAAWLDNLVTAEVGALAPGSARYAALLTPQGKILADFFVHARDDALLIELPKTLAPDIARRLALYRLRAKVAIEAVPAAVVVAWSEVEDGPGSPNILSDAVPDPRLARLGVRAVVAQSPGEAGEGAGALGGLGDAAPEDWHAHRIGLGVPEGGLDFGYGDAFPHEADMDQLGGVDFRKGCYVGQEVVSRMQHRGTARTRVVPVRLDAAPSVPQPASWPAPGTEVRAGERAIGTMGGVAGDRGFALLRLDRVAEAFLAGEPIRAGDTVLTPQRPDWWRVGWPGE